MSVDLIALYLKIYQQCQQSPDGVYKAGWDEFHRDTGCTINSLTPLTQNGTIRLSYQPGHKYHIELVKEIGHAS